MRGHNDGSGASNGQPCGSNSGRLERPFRIERLQTHDGGERSQVHPAAGRQFEGFYDELRGRHRGEQRQDCENSAREPHAGHGPQPTHWLRQGGRDRQTGAQGGAHAQRVRAQERAHRAAIQRLGQARTDAGAQVITSFTNNCTFIVFLLLYV